MVKKTERKTYLDILRILALFLVIFHHTMGMELYKFTKGVDRWLYMVISVFTIINVPMFFMISGATLLEKTESWKDLFTKRISRFLIAIFIFVFAFIVFENRINGIDDMSMLDCIFDIFAKNVAGLYSYWYIYSYLGLLVLLPFFRRIAKDFTKSDFWIIFILHFAFCSLIPIVNVYLQKYEIRSFVVSGNFQIPIITINTFFYPLVGYYVEHKVDIRSFSKKKIFGLIVLSGIGIIVSAYFMRYYGVPQNSFSVYLRLFESVTTVAVYILVKYFCVVVSPNLFKNKVSKVIAFVSALTFGMYLIDPFLKISIEGKYKAFVGTNLTVLQCSLLWCCISMLIGGVITYILKKVIVFRKIL